VQSGHVASGAIQGFFGATRHIASGTVGVFDFGSGAIVAGSIGSGAVVSGNVGSGQIGHFHVASGAVGSGRIGNLAVVSGSLAPAAVWTDHIASGAIAPRAVHVNPFHVNAPYQATTEEMISGLRAVALSQSGTIRIAMAAVSGRMPAVGVVISPDDAVSGGIVTVYTHGTFQFASSLADYSGYLGQTLFVGRSGHVVTASGSWNSGGLLSGDIHQPLGTAWNSGGAVMGMGAQLPFVPGLLLSGDIASGQLDTFHMASGAAATRATQIRPVWTPQGLTAVTNEMISGFRAVAINPSGFITIAMAAVSGRMPAVGVVPENVVSGDPVTVMSVGPLPFTSGLADFSGYLGKRVWVGRSGQVTTISGSWSSAGFASGDFGQPLGVVQRSGTVIINVYPFVTSGGPLGLPVAGGF